MCCIVLTNVTLVLLFSFIDIRHEWNEGTQTHSFFKYEFWTWRGSYKLCIRTPYECILRPCVFQGLRNCATLELERGFVVVLTRGPSFSELSVVKNVRQEGRGNEGITLHVASIALCHVTPICGFSNRMFQGLYKGWQNDIFAKPSTHTLPFLLPYFYSIAVFCCMLFFFFLFSSPQFLFLKC